MQPVLDADMSGIRWLAKAALGSVKVTLKTNGGTSSAKTLTAKH